MPVRKDQTTSLARALGSDERQTQPPFPGVVCRFGMTCAPGTTLCVILPTGPDDEYESGHH